MKMIQGIKDNHLAAVTNTYLNSNIILSTKRWYLISSRSYCVSYDEGGVLESYINSNMYSYWNQMVVRRVLRYSSIQGHTSIYENVELKMV